MIGSEGPLGEESAVGRLTPPPLSTLTEQIEAAAREQVVFNTGRRDYRKGIPFVDCPYPPGSTDASLWAQGYGEAREVDERRRY